jgi:integrase
LQEFEPKIDKYLQAIKRGSKVTYESYRQQIRHFRFFVLDSPYNSINHLFRLLKKYPDKAYDILNEYVEYLQTNNTLNPKSLKDYLSKAKNVPQFNDVDINEYKFRMKVKLPRKTRKHKAPLSKETIVKILNTCDNLRLKTYLLTLAATGMRPNEPLTIRLVDINFDLNPAQMLLRGEYTKTRHDRIVFLTDEAADSLKYWITYKYRTRRIIHSNHKTETVTPKKNDDDLVFAVREGFVGDYLYFDLERQFCKLLDRIKMDQKEHFIPNPKAKFKHKERRIYTLNSFRRFVKSTISDLGYSDYSEYFIGHAGSTYYTKPEADRIKMFRKVASDLTFLDYSSLEKRCADLQTKTDSLEAEMQRLQKLYKQREDVMSAMQKELLDHKQQLLYVQKMNTQLVWTKTTPFDSYTELLKNPQVTGPDREYVEKLLESYKSEETRKISALEEQINKLEARVDSSYQE